VAAFSILLLAGHSLAERNTVAAKSIHQNISCGINFSRQKRRTSAVGMHPFYQPPPGLVNLLL
jgi:hypothetical protein